MLQNERNILMNLTLLNVMIRLFTVELEQFFILNLLKKMICKVGKLDENAI